METRTQIIIDLIQRSEQRQQESQERKKNKEAYAHITKQKCADFLYTVCYVGEAISYKVFDFTNLHPNTAVKLRAYYRCITEKKFHTIAKDVEFNKSSGRDYNPKYILKTHRINKQMCRLIRELVVIGVEFRFMTDIPSKILISAGHNCTLKRKMKMAISPYPNKPNRPRSDGPIMKVSGMNRMRFDI